MPLVPPRGTVSNINFLWGYLLPATSAHYLRKRLKEAQEIDRLVNQATPQPAHQPLPIKKKKAQDTVDKDDVEKLVTEHLGPEKKKKTGKKRAISLRSAKSKNAPSANLVSGNVANVELTCPHC